MQSAKYLTPKRFFAALLLVVLTGFAAPISAQTVIDLNGGGVRAKTVDDYKDKEVAAKRAEKDSLAYIDHLTRAFNALHDDSLAKAEELFNLALKTRPDAPGNYVVEYNLGLIRLAQNRYAEAVEKFNAVLKSHPTLVDARYSRAVCYYELSSYQAAQNDCEMLLTGGTDNALKTQVLFLRSAIYSKCKQADKAKIDLEEILRLDPDNMSASLLLAGTFEELGQPQAALTHLNTFVTRHADSAEGRAARAELEMRMDMPQLARTDYDEAIKLAPEEAAYYIGRAKVLIALDNLVSARKDLDRAVELGQTRGSLTALYRQTQE